MAHRLAPMSVSDELWAALTAEAARQRRTAAAMARVILEDALLPKQSTYERAVTFHPGSDEHWDVPDSGMPEKRPPRRILRLGHEFKPYPNDNLHCSVPNCGRTLAKH